jgi:anthranilate synthase/aminodeoxychorismate synthase-like glutamine amidotransferase
VLLVLDNRDSFTFNLVQAFRTLGEEVRVVRAGAARVGELLALRPDRILIGPGPGRPEDAVTSLELLDAAPHLPVLGVCLGHQCLALAHGGRVERAGRLVHGSTVPVLHAGRGLFRGLPSPAAFTRYNSLTVLEGGLPGCLEVLARSADGDVMALAHLERPHLGVQFHPESILSRHGLALLESFLRIDAPPGEPSAATAPPTDGAARRRGTPAGDA